MPGKIQKLIKSMFAYPKYYHDKYGWYSIVNTQYRYDYNKVYATIINADREFYVVNYDWLIKNSIDENGNPAKRSKWV